MGDHHSGFANIVQLDYMTLLTDDDSDHGHGHEDDDDYYCHRHCEYYIMSTLEIVAITPVVQATPIFLCRSQGMATWHGRPLSTGLVERAR